MEIFTQGLILLKCKIYSPLLVNLCYNNISIVIYKFMQNKIKTVG